MILAWDVDPGDPWPMAGFKQRAKRYPTDLTDEEWLFTEPFLPAVAKRGRKPTTDLREVHDALRYLARTGGGWRMLPNGFPRWQTFFGGFERTYGWMTRWKTPGTRL